MQYLYPAIEPYNSGYLDVSSIHSIYFEEAGNPDGKPVLFLHGGPGGGIQPHYRRFFDPEHYRIILFDQRGAGKSKPHAELRENTTWDLVTDIEKLRNHLLVDTWVVFGGSWGSTLALVYTSQYPKRVKGLVLRGIFLCRSFEIDWFYQEGASAIYPDAWEQFTAPIPQNERDNMLRAYYQRLTGDNESVRISTAKAWSKWEASCSKLYQDQQAIAEFDEPELALAFARIESHYFINNIFLESDYYLLSQVEKIRHLPCKIVQGRYDMVCPVRTAWDLHKTWPEADFEIVQDAGHSAMEPGIAKALVHATNNFKHVEITN